MAGRAGEQPIKSGQNNTMKKADALELIQQGRPLIFTEWRSGEARTLSGTGKESGKPYSIPMVEHNVEIDGKPYTITQSLPDGTKTESYHIPFERGQIVALELDLIDAGKGMWRVKGTPHALE